MHNFQLSVFYDYNMLLIHSNFYRTYDALFSALDLSGFPDINTDVGRTGYSRRAMLRALIVKHREEIKSIPRLITFLDAHPALTEMCGFTMGCLPDESRFYCFLKEIPNRKIQNIHNLINISLIDKGALTLDTFIMDSKPVKAATKENNHKNPNRNTSSKNKKPHRNPQATLGYYSHYEKSDGSKISEFFWGYRTHVIISREGIPLIEITLPNTKTDARVAKTLIKRLKKLYKFKKGVIFIGDTSYDVRELYEFIITRMKCHAFIPINPRYTQPPKTFGPNGAPMCEAELEMTYDGWWHYKNSDKAKFRCPIKTRQNIAKQYQSGCPIKHNKFFKGAAYGCTKYLNITDDARSRVPRNSTMFDETYKQRIFIEQYFARLGNREADQTTHYTLRVVKNQITIAHLSQSLVALAAVSLNHYDKIRCFRTFAMTG